MSNRRVGRIVAAALLCAVIGLSAAAPRVHDVRLATLVRLATSGAPGPGGPVGGGFNARSGPAEGGAAGTVASVSASGFTLATSTGRQVDRRRRGRNDLPAGHEPDLGERRHRRP